MRLDVWIEARDEPVGQLVRRDDKSLSFAYRDGATALDRISSALPVQEEPYGDAAAAAFFGNLLFEGQELDRVRQVHGLDLDDVGGLLFHLGADCPGAISVTPEKTGPGKRPGVFPDDYEEIASEHLTEMIRSLHLDGRLPEGERDPSPVAGVQPKVALVMHEGRAYRPREGSRAPTTHILKVSPRNDPALCRHETALLNLARELGIAAAGSELREAEVAGRPVAVLLSTRFDRQFDGRQVTRLHSEDLCQALGLPRGLKYERDGLHAARRYSMAAVGRLAEQTRVPALFRIAFRDQTIFSLGVGNSDNHAKNSTLLYRDGAAELAPLYDVVPVVLDQGVTQELALGLGGAFFAEDVTAVALETALRDLGFAQPRLRDVQRLLSRIARFGVPLLAHAGDKRLADAVAAQLSVIEKATGFDLDVPERDWFPRRRRDERGAVPGGWSGLS